MFDLSKLHPQLLPPNKAQPNELIAGITKKDRGGNFSTSKNLLLKKK